MNDRGAGKALGVVIFLLAAGAVGAFFFGSSLKRYWMGHAFAEEDIQNYEALISQCPIPAGSSERIPPRKGKVLLLRPAVWQIYRRGPRFSTEISRQEEGKKTRRIDPPRIDDHWYELDSSLRASSPEEVGTAIFCTYDDWRGDSGWMVSQGGGPYQTAYHRKKKVRLTIFDVKARRCLGEYTLEGDDPRWAQPENHRDRPIPNIAAFVKEMPAR